MDYFEIINLLEDGNIKDAVKEVSKLSKVELLGFCEELYQTYRHSNEFIPKLDVFIRGLRKLND